MTIKQESKTVLSTEIYENEYILIDGKVHKITHLEPFMKGDPKSQVKVTALDVFNGGQQEHTFALLDHVDIPTIEEEQFTLKDIQGGKLLLLDGHGSETQVELPSSSIGKDIENEFKHPESYLLIQTIRSNDTTKVTGFTMVPKKKE